MTLSNRQSHLWYYFRPHSGGPGGSKLEGHWSPRQALGHWVYHCLSREVSLHCRYHLQAYRSQVLLREGPRLRDTVPTIYRALVLSGSERRIEGGQRDQGCRACEGPRYDESHSECSGEWHHQSCQCFQNA